MIAEPVIAEPQADAPLTALCPGSFDPVTNGHVDVIARTAACFDRLVVATVVNPAKPGRLPVEQRLELLREACRPVLEAGRASLEFVAADGLLVDIAAGVGATVVVKGLRSGTDFEYERTFAAMNASMAGLETMFVAADPRYSFVSSSLVWEIAALGGDVAAYVPASVVEALRAHFGGPDGRNQSAGASR